MKKKNDLLLSIQQSIQFFFHFFNQKVALIEQGPSVIFVLKEKIKTKNIFLIIGIDSN